MGKDVKIHGKFLKPRGRLQ